MRFKKVVTSRKVSFASSRENMKADCFVLGVCCSIVACVFGDDMTVKVGDSVSLKTDMKKKQDDTILWYFEDNRIALINHGPSTSCKYEGEGGRFRDRLEIDYETGYLSITDIRFEDDGCYEAELIRGKIPGKTTSLNRPRTCDSTKIIHKNKLGDSIKKINVNVRDKSEEKATTIETGNNKSEEKTTTIETGNTKNEEESSKIEIGKNKSEEESTTIKTGNTKNEEESSKIEIGKILGVVATIAVAVLLAVAGVICWCYRISRNAVMEKNKSARLLEDQRKDDSDVPYENPSNVLIN
ncbi:uncharacterized protein LOC127157553 [Labeo rohita]|uniref:uncharacterized protein LOC127157553 n=1 Tax=Labeo rohita TaxID=84645 RepID=UPI0021E2A712|nr:uncharacterized protein LOC127157553 [Labeo rohita]